METNFQSSDNPVKIKATEPVTKDNIFARLAEATQERIEVPNPQAPGEPLISDFISEDFAPEIEQEPDPQPEQPQPAQPEPEPVKMPLEYHRKQAEAIMRSLDKMSRVWLPKMLWKKLITPAEYDTAKRLKEEIWKKTDIATLNLNDDDLYVLYKLEQIIEYEKDLPISDNEIDVLVEPLAVCMQKWSLTISPEGQLAGAILMVFAPRLAPVLL